MLKKYLSDIAKMDRVIIHKRDTPSETNSYGEVMETTTVSTNFYAALSFDKKDEAEELSKESQYSYLYFLIRYRDVKLTDRITYENQDYDIANIEEVGGRKRFLRLKVKALI